MGLHNVFLEGQEVDSRYGSRVKRALAVYRIFEKENVRRRFLEFRAKAENNF